MKTLNKQPQMRLKDRAALFATAIVCIAVGLFFCLHVSHNTYIRWGGLALTIAFIFGSLIQASREFYRTKSFWILVATFVTLNLVIFSIILTHISEWKLPWFGIMLLEIPIFLIFRNRLQPR